MNSLQKIQEEATKAFGKELVQQIFGFLSDITRPPAKELGGLLADTVRFYRFKNQFKIIQKAMEYQREQGIRPQKIPLKVLAPLLEKCSWEEDEDMRKKWAALLTSATIPNENTDYYVTYVELLDNLSPLQARCLDIMYNEELYPARRRARSLPSYQLTSHLKESLNITKKELNILLDSLIRLNLIHPKLIYGKDTIDPSSVQRSFKEVSLTYLGQDFVKKCRIPFSKSHREKIEKVYTEVVEDIAKRRSVPQFSYFVSEVKKIYEYAREEDVRSAVLHALNKVLWKGGSIKDFNAFPLKPHQKEGIIKITMEELEVAYG